MEYFLVSYPLHFLIYPVYFNAITFNQIVLTWLVLINWSSNWFVLWWCHALQNYAHSVTNHFPSASYLLQLLRTSGWLCSGHTRISQLTFSKMPSARYQAGPPAPPTAWQRTLTHPHHSTEEKQAKGPKQNGFVSTAPALSPSLFFKSI